MKCNLRNLAKSVFLLAAVFIVFIQVVPAQSTPTDPATYWGMVTLDGKPAPTGTFITVEVEDTGEVVGRSTVINLPNVCVFSYGLSIEFEDPENIDTNNGKARSGDNLVWKVGGIVCSVPESGSEVAEPGLEKKDFNLVTSRAPELAPVGPRSVSEGDELTISLSATQDDDFDSLEYPINATVLCSDRIFPFNPLCLLTPYENEDSNSLTFSTNATFGELNDSVFSWSPGYTDAGVYFIEFNVSDSRGEVDSEVIELTVINVNRAPVLTEIGPQVIAENDKLRIELSATDEDGDVLIFSKKDNSVGNLDGNVFTWKPESSGTYFAELAVSDGEFEDSEVFKITVEDKI